MAFDHTQWALRAAAVLKRSRGFIPHERAEVDALLSEVLPLQDLNARERDEPYMNLSPSDKAAVNEILSKNLTRDVPHMDTVDLMRFLGFTPRMLPVVKNYIENELSACRHLESAWGVPVAEGRMTNTGVWFTLGRISPEEALRACIETLDLVEHQVLGASQVEVKKALTRARAAVRPDMRTVLKELLDVSSLDEVTSTESVADGLTYLVHFRAVIGRLVTIVLLDVRRTKDGLWAIVGSQMGSDAKHSTEAFAAFARAHKFIEAARAVGIVVP